MRLTDMTAALVVDKLAEGYRGMPIGPTAAETLDLPDQLLQIPFHVHDAIINATHHEYCTENLRVDPSFKAAYDSWLQRTRDTMFPRRRPRRSRIPSSRKHLQILAN